MVAVLPEARRAATEALDIEDEHAELLAGFYRKVWDSAATPDGVLAARAAAAAANPVDPGRAPPTVALLSNGEMIGYVTTIPAPVSAGGRELGAYWVKGLMVLPEHRNGPVGYLVLRQVLKRIGPAMAIVVQPAARKLFQALGFRDSGMLSNFVKPLRPTAVIRNLDLQRLGLGDGTPRLVASVASVMRNPIASRLAGGMVGVGLRAIAATAGRTGNMRPSGTAEPELDALWSRMRQRIAAGVVRNGRELHARYRSFPQHYVVSGAARPTGELFGASIVRRPRPDGDPRLNGIRVATISEVICDPSSPRDLRGTIASAEQSATGSGADLALASASDPRLCDALTSRGFFRVPANLHFLTRFPAPESDLPQSVDRWWLTRGDSAADEVF